MCNTEMRRTCRKDDRQTRRAYEFYTVLLAIQTTVLKSVVTSVVKGHRIVLGYIRL